MISPNAFDTHISYKISPEIISCGQIYIYELVQKILPFSQVALSNFQCVGIKPAEIQFDSCLSKGYVLLFVFNQHRICVACDEQGKHFQFICPLKQAIQRLSLETIRSMTKIISNHFENQKTKDLKVIEISETESNFVVRFQNQFIDCDIEYKSGIITLFKRPMTKRAMPIMSQ